MAFPLRQILVVLLATVLSAVLAISSAQAALTLGCGMAMPPAACDGHSATAADMDRALNGPDASGPHPDPSASGGNGAAADAAGASPCQTHACCPVAVITFDAGGLPSGHGVGVGPVPAVPLVDLADPEGPRRPPKQRSGQ